MNLSSQTHAAALNIKTMFSATLKTSPATPSSLTCRKSNMTKRVDDGLLLLKHGTRTTTQFGRRCMIKIGSAARSQHVHLKNAKNTTSFSVRRFVQSGMESQDGITKICGPTLRKSLPKERRTNWRPKQNTSKLN
jgi:hypothetical protein